MKKVFSFVWAPLVILSGGRIGLLGSWIPWAGSTAVCWILVSPAAGMTAFVVSGKVTAPFWVTGMAREANRRWPWAARIWRRFRRLIGEWRAVWVPTTIGLLFWAAMMAGALWL